MEKGQVGKEKDSVVEKNDDRKKKRGRKSKVGRIIRKKEKKIEKR
jgi:hypothetical protein